jgi:hypothetical protein
LWPPVRKLLFGWLVGRKSASNASSNHIYDCVVCSSFTYSWLTRCSAFAFVRVWMARSYPFGQMCKTEGDIPRKKIVKVLACVLHQLFSSRTDKVSN